MSKSDKLDSKKKNYSLASAFLFSGYKRNALLYITKISKAE
jgi:hypothetical protein